MDYKPGDFLVGIIDFFAILLPGALLAFAAKDLALTHVFGPILPVIKGEAQGWATFIFASYLLGHFTFLISSFLDELVYNSYRKRFLCKNDDRAFKRAKEIKEKHLNDNDAEIINPFKWAKANIQLLYPAATVEIHRLEADSKFFRSLIVVLLLTCPILIYKQAWIQFVACWVLITLSFVLYADQRCKSTELAYTYLIAIEKVPKPEEAQQRQNPSEKARG